MQEFISGICSSNSVRIAAPCIYFPPGAATTALECVSTLYHYCVLRIASSRLLSWVVEGGQQEKWPWIFFKSCLKYIFYPSLSRGQRLPRSCCDIMAARKNKGCKSMPPYQGYDHVQAYLGICQKNYMSKKYMSKKYMSKNRVLNFLTLFVFHM
jgi:hypothetical protein